MKIFKIVILMLLISCKGKQEAAQTIQPCTPTFFQDSFRGSIFLIQDPYARVGRFRSKHIKLKIINSDSINTYKYWIYRSGSMMQVADTIEITVDKQSKRAATFRYIYEEGNSYIQDLGLDDSALVVTDSFNFLLYRYVHLNDSASEVYYMCDKYGLLKKYSNFIYHDFEIEQFCSAENKYYIATLNYLKNNPEFHIRLDPKARWLQYEVVDTALVRQQKLNEIEEAAAVRDLLLDQEKIGNDSLDQK